jgi:hypothetical protein
MLISSGLQQSFFLQMDVYVTLAGSGMCMDVYVTLAVYCLAYI